MKVAKLILLAALLAVLPLSAHAAGPTITLSPSSLTVPVGQVVPMVVKINNVEGLYGFDLKIQFDPKVAQIEDPNPDTPVIELLPGDFLSYDFPVKNEADNAEGVIWYAVTQLNPHEAKSGSGTLFTIYVKGVAAGKSAFKVTEATLSDRNGMSIAVTWTNGEAQVSAAGAATVPANPTPLPTVAAPQLDLTQAVEQAAQTPAAPAQAEPAATAPLAATATLAPAATAAPVASAAPAQDAATPLPTAASAAVTSPTAPAASTTAAAAVETPAAASVTAETPVSDATTAATQAPAAPTAEQSVAQDSAASAGAPATTIVAPGGLNAPTRVASTTQDRDSNTLLLAGGGLLLLAAAGVVTLLLVRRGK